MPRPAASYPHVVASVRQWFGLHLHELALYLGLSKSLLHAIESGQKPLRATASTALLPLALLLPAPGTPAPDPATLPPSTPAPLAADLALRQRECQQQAARLLTQAAALARRAHVASRWAAALPTLLPPDPDAPGPAAAPATPALAAALALAADPLDPTRAPAHARWLRGWLHRRAQPLPPAEATHHCLLRARAAGLLAEAEALAACLEH